MALEDAAKVGPRKRFIELELKDRVWAPEFLRAQVMKVLDVSQAAN